MVPAEGGVSSRLTANPGAQTHPRFSPDGSTLAYISRDEGSLDVYLGDAEGGPGRRLTYMGAMSQVVGWRPAGDRVLLATDYRQPFSGWLHMWEAPIDGSEATPVGWGPVSAVSFGPADRGAVIARNGFDPARWKRYRGGRAGSLWIDRPGAGGFVPLVSLPGNLASPMWVGRRIYFLSDHEGVGNLYSVTPTGRGLTRHTHHDRFYARFPSTDGNRIVYHCGADLWLLTPGEAGPERLDVNIQSARPQLSRRIMAPGKFVESVELHPAGHSAAITARGTGFTMPLWEGAPVTHGGSSGDRRRLISYLADGDRVVSVSDQSGEETLWTERADGDGEPVVVDRSLGRIRSLVPAPAGADRVAITNHRHEVVIIDLTRRRSKVIHRSPHTWIGGVAWSPDGRWLAFAAATTRTTMNLFLHDTIGGRTDQIGKPEFVDYAPSFDPDGQYLMFLSARSFDPVPDAVFHDYGFPRSVIPMLIPLTADLGSPFGLANRAPRAPGAPAPGAPPPAPPPAEPPAEPPVTKIDIAGLVSRVLAFPVPPARYGRLLAARGRALLLQWPITGSLGSSWDSAEPPKGTLQVWEFATDKLETMAEGVNHVGVSADGKVVSLRIGPRLRVVAIGWRDDKNGRDTHSRETGWVDLGRLRIEVVPRQEWRQMFSEAWRLQRDYFWWEDMGGVDWLEVHDRYLELIDRVAARSEFSDLLWEMQGELGTSHAYELGGDYRQQPTWSQGSLGADLVWSRGAWRVQRIPDGDSWDPAGSSPLAAAGVALSPKDRVLAVDGVKLTALISPQSQLVDKAGLAVGITVASGRGRPRRLAVVPLKTETPLRYRDWVAANREKVHDLSGGRAGYLHIPDMQAYGFSEFHRAWRSEVDRDGLVIDVRFNRGGNVSQILLEKLVRRRLGFRVTRWRPPAAFPTDAPAGPMVCLTNEMAGSDGDIFSHTFKLHRLGPLIGTRTWGGVVGIWPQQSLVDGTITTQPEFGTWFTDVGYRVENFGTEPDIEVLITPGDYRAGRDPQLERGVAELVDLIERAGPGLPDLGPPPSLRPPVLPG